MIGPVSMRGAGAGWLIRDIEVHPDGAVDLVDEFLRQVNRDLARAAVATPGEHPAANQGVHVELGKEISESPTRLSSRKSRHYK